MRGFSRDPILVASGSLCDLTLEINSPEVLWFCGRN